jgi:hypothetical protein
MKTFESYTRSQFQLSELEYDNFYVNGTLFVRGDDGVRLNQTAKIDEMQEFRLTTERRRMHE